MVDFSALQIEQEESQLPVSGKYTFDIESAKARFTPYLDKIEAMKKEAESLEVKTDGTNEAAVAIGTAAKQLSKKIEEQRKEIVEEPNDFVKGINTFCKMFTEKLGQVESLMKTKIAQYRAVQEQARREAELAAEKARQDLQKKLDAQAKKQGTEPVKVEAPIIPRSEPVTRTETGAAYARKFWTFKVTDEAKVPREYLAISDTAIRKAINAGIRDIAGIEIYEENRTSFRT